MWGEGFGTPFQRASTELSAIADLSCYGQLPIASSENVGDVEVVGMILNPDYTPERKLKISKVKQQKVYTKTSSTTFCTLLSRREC